MQNFSKTSSTELVVFVDAFDCIALGSAEEFDRKWRTLPRETRERVLFSASKDNSATRLLFGAIKPEDRAQVYNRLVSGLYCGTAQRVGDLLDRLCRASDCEDRHSKHDDQSELTRLYKECDACIALDHACAFFYNIDWPDDVSSAQGMMSIAFPNASKKPRFPLETSSYVLESSRITVKATGEKPVFLHANGDLNIDAITNALELPPQQDSNRNYASYSTAYYMSMLSKHLAIFLIVVIVVLYILHRFLKR
jgi:hypothetical protein